MILTPEQKVNFPTLAMVPPEMLGREVERLKAQGQTEQQVLVNLEQDLSEARARSMG